MDPTTTFMDLLRAICERDQDQARELAEHLRDWLDRGGFLPERLPPDGVRYVIESVLRK